MAYRSDALQLHRGELLLSTHVARDKAVAAWVRGAAQEREERADNAEGFRL